MNDTCFWHEEIRAQGANEHICHYPKTEDYVDVSECYKCPYYLDISDAQHVLFNIMMEVSELL